MVTRLFLFLFFITLVCVSAMWFIENDGSITMVWLGYNIQTSVAFACLSAAILVVLLAMFLQLILWIKNYPKRFIESQKTKKKERGLTALTEGFAAIASGNSNDAKKLTKKAINNLGETSMTRFLSAQTAQSEGNAELAKAHYNAMLEDKKTKMIAIKGLLLQAKEEHDINKAIFLAEKAAKVDSKAKWPISILLDLYTQTYNLEKFEEYISKALKVQLIDSKKAKELIAIINLAKAMKNDEDNAVKYAKKAYSSLPNFKPAIIVYGRILIDSSRKKAGKIIEKSWKNNPHPELLEVYDQIYSNESIEKLLTKLESLYKINGDNPYINIEIAKKALSLKQLSKARNHLKFASGYAVSKEVCKLMITLEKLEESPNAENIRKWEEKMVGAPKIIAWSCHNCGNSTDNWQATCRNCGSFATLEEGALDHNNLKNVVDNNLAGYLG